MYYTVVYRSVHLHTTHNLHKLYTYTVDVKRTNIVDVQYMYVQVQYQFTVHVLVCTVTQFRGKYICCFH